MNELRTPADRLAALRREMTRRGLDGYLVPSVDDHASEYAGEHFGVGNAIDGRKGCANLGTPRPTLGRDCAE